MTASDFGVLDVKQIRLVKELIAKEKELIERDKEKHNEAAVAYALADFNKLEYNLTVAERILEKDPKAVMLVISR